VSADNGSFILATKGEFRVRQLYAAENLRHAPFNVVYDTFKDSPVFNTLLGAHLHAHDLEVADPTEHGIHVLNYYVNYTFKDIVCQQSQSST
jgi:hypothetical protein